jgi:hypothetical protein
MQPKGQATTTTTFSHPLDTALRLPNGARFYRCALQINPYAYQARNNKQTAFRTEAEYNAAIIVPGTLQDHRAFPCNGILPDLADFYGSAIRRAPFGRGATFAPKSRIGDVWSATLPQSDKRRVARDTERVRSWCVDPAAFECGEASQALA